MRAISADLPGVGCGPASAHPRLECVDSAHLASLGITTGLNRSGSFYVIASTRRKNPLIRHVIASPRRKNPLIRHVIASTGRKNSLFRHVIASVLREAISTSSTMATVFRESISSSIPSIAALFRLTSLNVIASPRRINSLFRHVIASVLREAISSSSTYAIAFHKPISSQLKAAVINIHPQPQALTRKPAFHFLLLTLTLILLSSCTPNRSAEPPLPLKSTSTPTLIPPADASEQAVQAWIEPIQLPPSEESASSESSEALALEALMLLPPTPLPDPLEFAFPTAAPEAVSLWRPPLYPTPWEPSPQDHFYFSRPIGADDVNWPLARYRYGYLLYSEPHTGIDIPAPKGASIMSAGPGVVTHAGYGLYFMRNEFKDPYGIAVAIKHDFGYRGQVLYTVYGHMNETFVYPGQRVKGGEIIGLVGETGNVTGPHLHFEVRVGDHTFFSSRNPELWIAPPQGWGVLVGRVAETSGRKIPQIKAKIVNRDTKRTYETNTYAEGSVNPDSYYDENLVRGDLPAGPYMLYLDISGVIYKTELEIRPGEVTYFSYRTKTGFDFTRPPSPGPGFIPPDFTLSASP